MNIFHIGMISFENKNTERELKAIGGIQGYIIELINFLLKNNIPVGFIGKVYNYRTTDNFNYYQVQKKVTNTNKFLIALFIKSLFIKLPKNAIIHAHRPDHFIAFSFFKNKPSIISLHGQQAKTVNDRKGKIVRTIYNFLEKLALKKANAIIAVDAITKNYYLKLYPQYKNKFHVIPTGVNTIDFKPLDRQKIREKFNFLKTDKVIIYVGRIEPPKKIKDIIKAFKILTLEDKTYKLILVGDGVQTNEIKKLTTSLKLDEFVSFFGIRKRSELPELFNLADISVLYSKNEGSPLSIKESLACGVPVVANCVGDITTVIKEGYNGYLVEQESVKQLAKKIKIAIENSTHLKENCIASIQNYTIEKVNQKVVDLYKIALHGK